MSEFNTFPCTAVLDTAGVILSVSNYLYRSDILEAANAIFQVEEFFAIPTLSLCYIFYVYTTESLVVRSDRFISFICLVHWNLQNIHLFVQVTSFTGLQRAFVGPIYGLR